MAQGEDRGGANVERFRHELAESLSRIRREIDEARARDDFDRVSQLQSMAAETERLDEEVRRFQLASTLVHITRDHGRGPYSREELAELSGLSDSDVALGLSELRKHGDHRYETSN